MDPANFSRLFEDFPFVCCEVCVADDATERAESRLAKSFSRARRSLASSSLFLPIVPVCLSVGFDSIQFGVFEFYYLSVLIM